MTRLNPIEAKILTSLLKRKSYATTAQVARSSKISWNTAESYLKEFAKKGWVEFKVVGRRFYWKVVRR